jgi:hypothetical protein
MSSTFPTFSIKLLVLFFTHLLIGTADDALSTGALKLSRATVVKPSAIGVLLVNIALLIIISVPLAALASRISVRWSTLVYLFSSPRLAKGAGVMLFARGVQS